MVLKKLIQGSKFDRFFRLMLNFLAPSYYNATKKVKFSEKTNFVFICYGGLGDSIMTFPFLIELSTKYPVTVFIDNNLKATRHLLNKNIVIKNYIKKDIFNELKKFQALNSNFILIQQSPIMEFIFFHFSLKRPPTIGFIYAQNIINTAGINIENKKNTSLNKINKYNDLLTVILSIENKAINKFYYSLVENQFKKLHYKDIPQNQYYILSATKNYNWKMGFLDFEIYAKLIIKMYEEINLIPVIVGTKLDNIIINKILKYIPKKIKIKNLTGETDIKDLIPLINNAKFIIANDNGIHHLSNFLNARTLTLYNFSAFEVYNWPNKNSEYIFNPIFKCMPCIGMETGPFDNHPFKCPWDVRCKNTISENDIIKKLGVLSWIN